MRRQRFQMGFSPLRDARASHWLERHYSEAMLRGDFITDEQLATRVGRHGP